MKETAIDDDDDDGDDDDDDDDDGDMGVSINCGTPWSLEGLFHGTIPSINGWFRGTGYPHGLETSKSGLWYDGDRMMIV